MIDYEKLGESVQKPEVWLDPSRVYTKANDTEEVFGLDATEEELKEALKAARGSGDQEQKEYFPVNHPKYQGIASSKGYDQEYGRLQRTHYSHEAMIDAIIANPNLKQRELAEQFEKTQAWVSRIIGSDAFQAALAKRREELTDPFLIATIEERFRGLAMQSLDIIAEKLEASQNPDLAIKALDLSTKAMGFGARDRNPGTQNNFVIQLPPKIENAKDWAETFTGKVIEG